MKRESNELHFPHPGEILREEFLIPMGISQYRLARDLGIPPTRVTSIVKQGRAISADTALRLSRYFGTSAEFWLGLQKEYELRKRRAEAGADIERDVTPLGQVP